MADETTRVSELIYRLGAAAHRRPGAVALGTLLVVALSWQGFRQIKIDTDLRALLPQQHKTVQRLDAAKARIGSQSNFLVVVRSPDRAANLRFGAAIAAKMRAMREFRYVIFERDLSVAEARSLLYLPLKELLELRQGLIKRIKKEVDRRVAIQLDDDDEDEPESGGSKSGTKGQEATFKRDPKELLKLAFGGAVMPGRYLEAEHGQLVVVKARAVEETTNVQFCIRSVAKVEAAIRALAPSRFHAQLSARVEGDYEGRAKESASIRGAVTSTIGAALGLLVLVILLFFRSVTAVVIVLVPVVVSSFATIAIGVLLFGTFNLVTTFIFAVLLGLGIDFAIHALARYAEERRGGGAAAEALRISLTKTGSALLAGAATTAAAFFSLLLADLRGFSQFGAVAGIGVLCALLATYVLVPALLGLFGRVFPALFAHRGAVAERSGSIYTPTTLSAIRRAISGVIFFSLASVSLYAVFNYRSIGFEYDFTKLGKPPRPPAKTVAPKRSDHRDAIGHMNSYGPAVALCKQARDCEQVVRLLHSIKRATKEEFAKLFAGDSKEPQAPALDDPAFFEKLERSLAGGRLLPAERERLRALGKERALEMRHFLLTFWGVQLLIPDHQQAKLKIIADMRTRIDKKRSFLSPASQRELARWEPYLKVREPMTLAELPTFFTQQLTEVNGALGRFVVIYNRGTKANYADAKRLHRAFFSLPAGSGVQVPVAANYFVLVDVIDTLRAEGPLVLSVVGVALFICLLLSLRSLAGSLLVLTNLLISVGWLAAAFLFFGWKVNLFSIVAFPLLLGMGIDNGIHVYHRWMESRSLWAVVRGVGGPITLATLTTFIGFGGLLLADHVGIQTLGMTAGFGMWLTHAGAVIALPALLVLVSAAPASKRA